MSSETNHKAITKTVVTPAQLLEHWQGHRRLTRKTIEAFPEEKLLNHSIGGMRPFAIMIQELLAIAGPGIEGLVTDKWQEYNEDLNLNSKKDLLKAWDTLTDKINNYWSKIPLEDFQKEILAFGLYEGTVQSTILYFIDNEIHHRGQAYVYLRSLGIEPPMFWDKN
ncbi:Uncharacterized damage-inducible protein DinB (forms a four-helix bundle) [Zhouia amylolytica]|uniref:Uncharacterized damage-inducible protein DinB (Forms a four-helix bundle) n=1 Tax=Zhouia amylolytica TaxID=376730 RepID=A0A1I6QBX3_9FLAO|nr:DinB family protein [Zhouia amylolytica]MCQ0111360.1 DinB family protein [Zhouia amylolytica]SFS49790.1 Uncharacterized damage-inducible protein DinB (forms a four-helix bundle) [Zhouia amylolytica]